MNALLPDDHLGRRRGGGSPPDFHPRYDAVARSYVYRVGARERERSPFHARWCWPLARRWT
jgi:tRNA U38,U39,U40 pseudouridine synthase TruA